MIIRRTQSPADMEKVWRLTHDEYVRMGYARPRPDGMLRHYGLDGIPQTKVWVAEDDHGEIVGTVSLTEDNPAGLHVDEDFRDVVDGIRSECAASGKRLVASWRIVTRHQLRGGLRVAMGLVAAIVGDLFRGPDYVSLYTFNPKHESFYQRLCGLRRIAGPRPGRAVRGAPAILMRGDFADMSTVWQSTRRRRSSARLRPSDTRELQPV